MSDRPLDAARRRFPLSGAITCALLLVLAFRAEALAQCGPGAGDCFKEHATPGCEGFACCDAVCVINPTCCDGAWDALCVEFAKEECADIPCPGDGDCFVAHAEPACNDEGCCNFTCQFDSFCCGGQWDEWCVTQALALCDAKACAIVVPKGAIEESELCDENLNDGCNVPAFLGEPGFIDATCGLTYAGHGSTGAPRDGDWYAITLAAPATVTLELTTEFPAEILLVRGTCDAIQTLAGSKVAACTAGVLSVDVDAGVFYLVVTMATAVRQINNGIPCPDDDPKTEPGFFGNRYFAMIDCAAVCAPADLNCDGVVDGADLGALLASWGACAGCAADLDGDGVVDGADFGAMLAAWG